MMVKVSYKRTVVLIKILVCILFFATAGFILYAIINWNLSLIKQLMGYGAIFLSITYFGAFFIILTIHFFRKDTTLFSYDDKYLYLLDEKYEISNIKKFTVPEKRNGIMFSPTFLFYVENREEPIAIPTNHVFLDKELNDIIEKMKKDVGLKENVEGR